MNKYKFQRINYEWQQISKILFLMFLILFSFSFVFAHSDDAELNAEIQKGRELVEKFYRGEVRCQDLTNEDFHSVGEYVMEQMVGGSDHLTMNKIIEQMHGKEGEELMHINMGKRYLGCDVNTFQNRQFFMMPMNMWNKNTRMMDYWQNLWNLNNLNLKGWNIIILIFILYLILIILLLPVLLFALIIWGIVFMIKKFKSDAKKE